MDLIEKMKTEMLRRKYSTRTIKSYLDVVKTFLKWINKNREDYSDDLQRIRKSDVKEYLNTLHNKSGSTINVHLQSLKFMMEEILHKNCYVHIRFSKTPKQAPEYLTKEELISLFNAINNAKHKLMIKLLYGAGLRVSELVNLRVRDFEFNDNSGWVRHGKGNKDRLFIIPISLKNELMGHISENELDHNEFIFTGNNGHYSVRSIQEIINNATKKAKIKKNVHPHTLRHSFATHLMENEYDAITVQSLLGHNDVRTTMIYAHVVKPKVLDVKSPLDC